MNAFYRIARRPEAITALLLVIAFGSAALLSRYFLDARYLLESTSLYMETGLLILAMTVVIIGGQIDLSIASILALSACASLQLQQHFHWPSGMILLLSPLIGAALGSINGVLVARWRLPSLAVTLATLALYRGVAQIIAGDHSVKMPEALSGFDFQRLPGTLIPAPLLVFLGFAILFGILVHKSVFGRWVYAVGTNELASGIAGIPVRRVQILMFTLSGATAGMAAVLLCSRLGVARYDHARGMELDVITAVVLGGASIFGGRGTIGGSVLALFLVMVIRTALGVANVKAENQLACMGALLIAAVLLSQWSRRLSERPTRVTTKDPVGLREKPI